MLGCPACGYPHLAPLHSGSVCPCCGFIPDKDGSPEQHRIWWIINGRRWWSPVDAPPSDWSPSEQLRRLGIVADAVQD